MSNNLFDPAVLKMPFANNGDKNQIPDTPTGSNLASLAEGFPLVTQKLPSQGGIPPAREDFNGIMNLNSQFYFFNQNGGLYTFRQDVSDAIGGYPENAALWYFSDEGLTLLKSAKPNNTDNFAIDPSVVGISWIQQIPTEDYVKELLSKKADLNLMNTGLLSGGILEMPNMGVTVSSESNRLDLLTYFKNYPSSMLKGKWYEVYVPVGFPNGYTYGMTLTPESSYIPSSTQVYYGEKGVSTFPSEGTSVIYTGYSIVIEDGTILPDAPLTLTIKAGVKAYYSGQNPRGPFTPVIKNFTEDIQFTPPSYSIATRYVSIAQDGAFPPFPGGLKTILAEYHTDGTGIDWVKVYQPLDLSAVTNKAEKDLSNITPAGKSLSVGWCIPDYTAGIAVPPNQNYVAPCAGVIICYTLSNYAGESAEVLRINDKVVGVGINSYVGRRACLSAWASAGDTIHFTLPGGTGWVNTFYPLKGGI